MRYKLLNVKTQNLKESKFQPIPSEASFLEGVKVNLSSNPIGKLMNPPNP